MQYVPVTSTSIEAIGYNAPTSILSVIFLKNKSVYFYPGVPADVFDAFLAAESKGTYLAAAIKGKYSYFKLEDVELFPKGTLDKIKAAQQAVAILV